MKKLHALVPLLTAASTMALGLILLPASSQALTSSPYVTVQGNVPLDQSAEDSVNGLVPFYSGTSFTPPEGGTILRLSDATSASAPSDNVIPGPENTPVHLAWDLGEPDPGKVWQLDRVDIWIAASDNLRKGFDGSFSVSLTGEANDFTVIPDSLHQEDFTENPNFNHVRYDFPDGVAEGFRYLRLDSFGRDVGGTTWQPRYVEIDVWASQVPEPGAFALLAGGLVLLGGYCFRRNRG